LRAVALLVFFPDPQGQGRCAPLLRPTFTGFGGSACAAPSDTANLLLTLLPSSISRATAGKCCGLIRTRRSRARSDASARGRIAESVDEGCGRASEGGCSPCCT